MVEGAKKENKKGKEGESQQLIFERQEGQKHLVLQEKIRSLAFQEAQ